MTAFKAYDIRGIYGKDVTEELAYKVGRAFVRFNRCKEVVVGRDMRLSSPKLFKELAQGINDEGADVIDIGMCTTPMLSFAVAHFEHDCGIMISASHNPGEYNAFKLIGKKGLQLSSDSGIKDIQKIVEEDKFEKKGSGNILKKDMLNDYINHHMKFAEDISGLKVVIDYGNGVGSISASPLLKGLKIELIEMYPEPDGNFPNHPANPLEFENLKDLQKKVIEEKADIGFAFDGDADRALAIDENGNIIMPDLCLTLLAEDELSKKKGEKVYYDLRFSRIVSEKIKEYGGIPVMMRVGNPFYKEKLINEGGALAGELSGHIMYKDNYNIDDGLFAVIKILHIIAKSKKKISELILPLKKYASSEEINMKVKDADAAMKKAKDAFSDGESVDLDGVYISYPDWWFNLRKSNTEPLVRLRLEADTKEKLEEKKEQLMKIIKG